MLSDSETQASVDEYAGAIAHENGDKQFDFPNSQHFRDYDIKSSE